jgi:hypothetical protein
MATFTKNPAAPAAVKEDHDLDSYNGVIIDNINKFFLNSDPINCPSTSCSLLQSGCTNPSPSYGSALMSAKSPYAINVGLFVKPDVKE